MSETAKIGRRGLLGGAAALGIGSALSAAGLPGRAFGQSFPSRPVKWLCYQAAGGTMDLTIRGVQPFLDEHGVKTQIDYVVGGSGNVARTELYSATPDGYTIMMESAPSAALGELVTKGNYKSNEFEPIYGWSVEGWQICTKKGSPIHTIKDLVALSKKRPVVAASIGRGGASHLQLILLGEIAGIKMNIVHFAGSSRAYPQAIGGNVDIVCAGPGSGSRSADRLQFICIFRDHEPALPGVPSAKAQGYAVPSIDQIWYADTAPKVPEDRVAKLEAAFRAACTAPGFAAAQAKAGILAIEQLDRKKLAPLLKAGYELARKYQKDLTG